MQTANYRLRNAAILGAFVLIGGAWRQHSLADEPAALEREPTPVIESTGPNEQLNAALVALADHSERLDSRLLALESQVDSLRAETEAAQLATTNMILERLDSIESYANATPQVDPQIPALQSQIEELNLQLASLQIQALAAIPAEPERILIEPPSNSGPALNDENGYLTRAGIHQWLSTHDTGRDWSYSGGDENMAEHLISDHGWKDWQVEELSIEEAESLHDASHNGLVTPTTKLQADYALPSTSTAGVPIYWRNGRWEWEFKGTTFAAPELWEGYESDSGNYRYRDGRMLVYEQQAVNPAPAVTSSRPAQSAPRTSTTRAYASSGNCPNGNCGRPMTWRWQRRGR